MKTSGRFAQGKTQWTGVMAIATAILMMSCHTQAAVYKKVDADGNVSFSDVPDKSAQLINVAPLSTVAALSPEQIAKTLKRDDTVQPAGNRAENYTLTIISPTPDQTFQRAADAFSANVQVQPDLKNGDRLVLLVDGKTSSDQIPAGELDRGTHQFEAKVLSSNGRVLTSKVVSFNVQQSSVKQQARMGINH
ncbi:DUF4124 domain-containing protein [Aquirhabdus sp.]|uniref:DUF4124 domain-containing protein n=1 Tax=Aquirhabdus sp. TaxID=2824160 RepID=UPI00396C50AF